MVSAPPPHPGVSEFIGGDGRVSGEGRCRGGGVGECTVWLTAGVSLDCRVSLF